MHSKGSEIKAMRSPARCSHPGALSRSTSNVGPRCEDLAFGAPQVEEDGAADADVTCFDVTHLLTFMQKIRHSFVFGKGFPEEWFSYPERQMVLLFT